MCVFFSIDPTRVAAPPIQPNLTHFHCHHSCYDPQHVCFCVVYFFFEAKIIGWVGVLSASEIWSIVVWFYRETHTHTKLILRPPTLQNFSPASKFGTRMQGYVLCMWMSRFMASNKDFSIMHVCVWSFWQFYRRDPSCLCSYATGFMYDVYLFISKVLCCFVSQGP